MSEIRLSAVVTCYKDGPAIRPMYERLTAVFASLGVDYEIIFVNDASPDEADAVLSQITAEDVHVLAIEHSRNFGSQNAFMSGMQASTGDAVVLLDGDLQDPPELIFDFYEKWRQGYEVVYGSRGQREGSVLLKYLAKAFYKVFQKLSDVPMPLDAGDFSLMDRRVVDLLLGFKETDQFLRGLRAWVGFRQIGVDYLRPERAFGRSTHSFSKNIWWAKKGIFSFSFLPIEYLGYAALSLTGLSTLALIGLGVAALRQSASAYAVEIVVAVIAFFGSLNLLAIALFGEYLIKVLEESKRRPKFICRAIRCGSDHFQTPEQIDHFLRRRRRPNAQNVGEYTAGIETGRDD